MQQQLAQAVPTAPQNTEPTLPSVVFINDAYLQHLLPTIQQQNKARRDDEVSALFHLIQATQKIIISTTRLVLPSTDLCLIAPVIQVDNPCCVNLSGVDGLHGVDRPRYPGTDQRLPRNGNNGTDGGNLIFIADHLLNSHLLTFMSRGGNGGHGESAQPTTQHVNVPFPTVIYTDDTCLAHIGGEENITTFKNDDHVVNCDLFSKVMRGKIINNRRVEHALNIDKSLVRTTAITYSKTTDGQYRQYSSEQVDPTHLPLLDKDYFRSFTPVTLLQSSAQFFSSYSVGAFRYRKFHSGFGKVFTRNGQLYFTFQPESPNNKLIALKDDSIIASKDYPIQMAFDDKHIISDKHVKIINDVSMIVNKGSDRDGANGYEGGYGGWHGRGGNLVAFSIPQTAYWIDFQRMGQQVGEWISVMNQQRSMQLQQQAPQSPANGGGLGQAPALGAAPTLSSPTAAALTPPPSYNDSQEQGGNPLLIDVPDDLFEAFANLKLQDQSSPSARLGGAAAPGTLSSSGDAGSTALGSAGGQSPLAYSHGSPADITQAVRSVNVQVGDGADGYRGYSSRPVETIPDKALIFLQLGSTTGRGVLYQALRKTYKDGMFIRAIPNPRVKHPSLIAPAQQQQPPQPSQPQAMPYLGKRWFVNCIIADLIFVIRNGNSQYNPHHQQMNPPVHFQYTMSYAIINNIDSIAHFFSISELHEFTRLVISQAKQHYAVQNIIDFLSDKLCDAMKLKFKYDANSVFID